MIKLTRDQALEYIKDIGVQSINLNGFLYANPNVTDIYTNDNYDGILIYDGSYGIIFSKTNDFLLEAYASAPLESLGCVKHSDADFLVANTDLCYNEFCNILSYTQKKAPTFLLPPNLTLKPIDIKDIDYINDYYTYKSENSRQRLLDEINSRTSSALYQGDKILAWNLIHKDMALGVMFVPPQNRGKGYAQIVAADLMQKIIDMGLTPYVQIVHDNTASYSLATKLGFKKIFEGCWLRKYHPDQD